MSFPASEPRTNSLAFAKTDCHTCTANRGNCDRKRPRCSFCSDKYIICGGYPMQLTWPKSKPQLPEVSLTSVQTDTDYPFQLDPLSLQASLHLKSKNNRSRQDKPRKFKFVTEQTVIQKSNRTRPCQTRHMRSFVGSGESETRASVRHSSSTTDRRTSRCLLDRPLIDPYLDDGDRSEGLGIGESNFSDLNSMLFPVDFSADLFDWPNWNSTGIIESGTTDMLGELGSDSNKVTVLSVLENRVEGHDWPIVAIESSWSNRQVPASPVLYKSFLEKFETLLNMYDQEFCVMPLNGDIPSNPFRCRSEMAHGSQSPHMPFLQYPPTMLNTAMELYRTELDTYTKEQGLQLLDTTMVLFLFNATQSAFGNWATRINDAGKLLKLSGGEEVWASDRKIQAQVVMLLWWDATIALLSRQGCLLPYSYFELLLGLEDKRYWTFLDLIGCPKEFVVSLMQLASLAEENEKAASMRWTTFDLTFVDEIQASILSWENPGLEVNDDISEDQMHEERDGWHCTEIWRYGLLIYITRVFRWNRSTRPPSKLAKYARFALDHIRSCRQTTVVQKGALLPLFLAGCEIKDAFLRQTIRDYCQYWDNACGYNLFSSAASLLEDVWMEQDGSGGDTAWWGSIIDKKQPPNQSYLASMQFCFG